MRFQIVYIIARQFFRTSFQNKAVLGLTIILSLMLLMATFIGWKSFDFQNQLRTDYQQQVREQWVNNPDKHPHRMAHYGYFVFRPKHPLSFFDFGMESFTGVSVFLEAHRQNTVNFSEASFSTGILRFGEMSIAMVLQLLVPLLLLFLGFNAISALKENGTLKILLCQGVSWQELMMGNALSITTVALVLYAPVMLLTIIFWLLLNKFQMATDDVVRLLVLLISYFVYLIIWSLVAVLVSALSKTSKASLSTLIGIWILLMIVLPRTAQALGAQKFPSPSKVAFEAAIEQDISAEGDSHNPDDPHYKALKDSLLKAYNIDNVQQLPFNYSGFIMAEGEQITSNIYARHQRRLMQTYERQNRFSRYVAFINPYIALKNFSMALTGSDFASYSDFMDEAEKFRYQMAQRMNRLQIKYISNAKLGDHDKPYSISRSHWAQMPDFHYEFKKSSYIFSRERLSIAALLFWLLLPLVLLFTITKKFKTL
jgi:ABC-2 type transport system permease protein